MTTVSIFQSVLDELEAIKLEIATGIDLSASTVNALAQVEYKIQNFPTTYTIDNFPTSFEVSNFPIDVAVNNFPTGFDVNNFPANQTVTVSNFPTGFNVNNLPADYPATNTVAQLVTANTTQTAMAASLVAIATNTAVTEIATPNIHYQDSTANLGPGSSFTGTWRDLHRVSAGSPVTVVNYGNRFVIRAWTNLNFTLWFEESEDQVLIGRTKSVSSSSIGSRQVAEIIVEPVFRYGRVGLTNTAVVNTTTTLNIGSTIKG